LEPLAWHWSHWSGRSVIRGGRWLFSKGSNPSGALTALYCWILEILYCNPKGLCCGFCLREGRSVCLCWVPENLKDLKDAEELPPSATRECPPLCLTRVVSVGNSAGNSDVLRLHVTGKYFPVLFLPGQKYAAHMLQACGLGSRVCGCLGFKGTQGGKVIRRPYVLFVPGYLQGYLAYKKSQPLGPYRSPMPRVLGGSLRSGCFLMSEVPMQQCRHPPLLAVRRQHPLMTTIGP